MRLLLILFTSIFTLSLTSQDTLTVLQYNLLYYGEITDWCDNSNNNINNKDDYLRTIVNYVKPDIFAVNEMSKSPSIHLHLLDQVMNTNGINYYKKADFLSQDAYNIVNMLYFNSEKLALHSHTIAQSYIRDIDVYKLYHLSDDLIKGDTAFVICVVAHLKSSSGTTNENKRKVMAENTMNYLNSLNDDDNYLMMGDFNVYSADEPAYQQFINHVNPVLRFIDPINQEGDWNNNSDFRHVHTQSTHADNNGCASYGGMDDRFDFILISNNIKDGLKNVTYIPNSYNALGQDGEHFNKSINDSPTNTSVPSDVLSALYHNSDHLPITLKLLVDKNLGINSWISDIKMNLVNPFKDELLLSINSTQLKNIEVQIVDLMGKLQLVKQLSVSGNPSKYNLPVHHLKPGFYIIRILNGNELLISKKVVKL